MSQEKFVGLRIDVDTLRGTREGVFKLIDIFSTHNVKGTFFFTLGPDNSGKAIWNVFRQKGFLKKMLRTNALKLYGWSTITSGLLKKAKEIGIECPESIRAAHGAGHEVGYHAWDHRRWQDNIWTMQREEIFTHFKNGADLFEEITGTRPKCNAAPSWKTSALALEEQDKLNLTYASDIRADEICFLSCDGKKFSTPQVPASTRCLEEYQCAGINNEDTIIDEIVKSLKQAKAPTITIHAEVEGNVYGEYLKKLITKIKAEVGNLVPLQTLAQNALKDKEQIPVMELSRVEIEGRSGEVSSAKHK